MPWPPGGGGPPGACPGFMPKGGGGIPGSPGSVLETSAEGRILMVLTWKARRGRGEPAARMLHIRLLEAFGGV